ncbi:MULTISPECIES: carboxypeptidase M32 [Terrabacteria group]|uniref:carboxypeptidase M32 n=1 Tax=Bacillati TaxID=1783272 RepID=UPI0019393E77|nr:MULTISPECIES: carboxypeptidase M32 [Terrabacteria group]MBW9212002.1 carboxypeptidase M32 [Trueperella sp. zg.1013]QRG87190.1 carboxypeptidase M32 [Bulleidia sp. zg-1006]
MNKEELMKTYQDWKFSCSAYEMALTIIGIDKQTVAPSSGASYRDPRTAYLAGIAFEKSNNPKMKEVMEALLKEELNEDFRKEVEMELKETEKYQSVPQDFYVAHYARNDASYDAWLKAKKEEDFEVFKPHVQGIIEDQKKLIAYRNKPEDVYHQLLSDNENGVSVEFYDDFFNTIKKELLPFIQKLQSAKQPDTSFLEKEYPIAKQKEFMEEVLDYIHYTSDWGYQNESEHPFTTGVCENDVRTTTKYLLNNPVSSILSTVHECGHAYFEHNVHPKYDGTILAKNIKMGIHESQSRLLENYLGRSEAFWQYLYPKFQEVFPEQLSGVDLWQFIWAINKVKPSLVRTEADEVTYPLHILIRYELEKEIFANRLNVDDLERAWNAKYQEYLGIHADKVSEGVLQDVHWSGDGYGYFPTYALGSAISAQIFHTMEKQIDVDEALRTGHFEIIMDWLKENVHQYGASLSFQEILMKCTGEPFNIQYYIDYLKTKFTKLYQL